MTDDDVNLTTAYTTTTNLNNRLEGNDNAIDNYGSLSKETTISSSTSTTTEKNGAKPREMEAAEKKTLNENRLALPASPSSDKETTERIKDDASSSSEEEGRVHPLKIIAILSSSFAYGLIVTTTFLVILPLECARIEYDHSTSSSLLYSKSISLAFFVSLAGLTQLISPLIGLLSDHISIPASYPINVQILGKRLPYLLLGTTLTTIGLLSQLYTSIFHLWGRYTLAFFFNILGLTVLYSVMIALIPDLIPPCQVGEANGTWAFMLVLGSLCGFGLFYSVLKERLVGMYCLYVGVMVAACGVTVMFVAEEETARRKRKGNSLELKEEEEENKKVGKKEEDSTDSELGHLNRETSPLLSSNTSSDATSSNEIEKNKTTISKPRANQNQHHRTKDDNISILDILRIMLVDPIQDMSCSNIRSAYTISPTTHFDFLIVTISRTFYYMALSNQSFFLYFVHDVIGEHSNPEAAVSLLAIVGQMAGAITCYPVGIISDSYCHSRRRPFVYLACIILAMGQLALLGCRDMKQMIVVCVIMGGANGIYLTMDTSLAVDTLDVNENEDKGKDGEEDTSGAAQLLGVWGVADFIGSALGPLVGGPLLYIFGTTSSSSTSYSTDDDVFNTITDGSFDESSMDTSTIQQGGNSGNWYAFEGYAAIMTMSAIYSLGSAFSLLFIRKKGV